MASLDSDIRRMASIEERFSEAQKYVADVGFLRAAVGRLGRDHSRLHGVADAARALLKAMERAELAALRKARPPGESGVNMTAVPFPLEEVRQELVALADQINDLDRTVNRSD